MSRKVARFTHAELSRAARVAKALGVTVELMPGGSVRIAENVAVPVRAAEDDVEPVRRIVF